MHGDHFFGLPGLLSTMQLLGRKTDLHIYGPLALEEYLNFHIRNFGLDKSYKIIFHPVGEGPVNLLFSDKKIDIFSIPLKHRIDCSGFLFQEKPAELNINKMALEYYRLGIEQIGEIKKGKDLVLSNGKRIENKKLTLPPWKSRSYAYISDTAFMPELTELINGVDLLYHESTFAREDAKLAKSTFHSTSVQAATIAKDAGAKKLVLGHFSSRYKNLDDLLLEAKSVFENSFLAAEGVSFEIVREREEIISE